MDTPILTPVTAGYAKCIEASKKVRWDIDKDVIRGRTFDYTKKFIPDKLARMELFGFANADEKRLISQVQGRTYANMFAMVERFVTAKMIEISRSHTLGDQNALEALVRFADEELKHQELFRRIERMIAIGMPAGYRFVPRANDVAWIVLGKSTWAVLALTSMVELVTQAHYRESIAPDPNLSELYKDIFFYHWREESQHAVLDELEWRRENERLSPRARDEAVNDLIALFGAFDGVARQQSQADAAGFLSMLKRPLPPPQRDALQAALLRAYRWQYILSGAQDERFANLLAELTTEEQGRRIAAALEPLAQAARR